MIITIIGWLFQQRAIREEAPLVSEACSVWHPDTEVMAGRPLTDHLSMVLKRPPEAAQCREHQTNN
jgi:hypothetical protein